MNVDKVGEARESAVGTEPTGGGRLLFIVSRRDLDRYDYLKKTFRGEARMDVVLDRRRAERRRHDVHPAEERRRGDRRKLDPSENLKSLGWAMIRQNAQEHRIQ